MEWYWWVLIAVATYLAIGLCCTLFFAIYYGYTKLVTVLTWPLEMLVLGGIVIAARILGKRNRQLEKLFNKAQGGSNEDMAE